LTSSAGEQIVPVILVYDEEANIGRTLNSVRWAREVIVVDSGSSDRTEEIARSFANVKWHLRSFDTHRAQWSYGINETGIKAEYVLALDADMQVPTPFLAELESKFLPGDFNGGMVAFEYSYYGYQLSGSLCPPQLRLFRRSLVRIGQSHHTQEFTVEGGIYRFKSPLIHDDQKSIERWLSSQLAYQTLIEKSLFNGGRKRFRDLLRRLGIMPPLIGALAYIKAGGPLRGAAAARYAYERSLSESILTLMLLDARLKKNGSGIQQKNAETEKK
jgi:glycosyltransferase involved in cell wall biosynthesis